MTHGNTKNSPEIFESKLDKSSGCWIWPLNKDRDGYGRTHYLGKEMFTHRLAYQLWVGPLERGKVIMHMCDNPPCCNPSHLKQGTKNGNAKLTEYQVLKIREWYPSMSQDELSKIFNISRVQIRKIINFKNWT